MSNLDAKLRVQMRTELFKLHHQLNTTIIYVTHDQVEAMAMGTIIVIMIDGVVNQMGASMEITDSSKDIQMKAWCNMLVKESVMH